MNPRPHLRPGQRVSRTVLLRNLTLLLLAAAGIATYAAWVAPLWMGDGWHYFAADF